MENYRFLRSMKEIGSTKVVLARSLEGENVVLKTVQKSDALAFSWLKREAELLGRLNSHNIVRFVEVLETESEFTVVLEYLGDDLLDTINSGSMEESLLRTLFLQVCHALEHMHSKDIVHLDLKPENICLSRYDPNLVKLIDFGSAVCVADLPAEADIVTSGTEAYLPPEVFTEGGRRKRDFLKASDVWSCGILLYALCAGHIPWAVAKPSESMEYVLFAHREFPALDCMSEWPLMPRPVLTLLEHMLALRPEDRWDMARVCAFVESQWTPQAGRHFPETRRSLSETSLDARRMEYAVEMRVEQRDTGDMYFRAYEASTASEPAYVPFVSVGGLSYWDFCSD